MISVKLGLLLLLASYISAFGLKEFCYSDEDCDGGKCVPHFMKGYRCIPSGSCYYDGECNHGEKCVKHQYATLGTCEKVLVGECRNDKDCSNGWSCIRGCPWGELSWGCALRNGYVFST